MQHHYWITKQTLSRKFGRKDDDCIVASDAQLDAKLELFRNIQMSCALIQRIIDKYQESICYLSQETNSMGRFLKENSDEDKTKSGEVMLLLGKSLIVCAQQQLVLHEPLVRFYQELETFRQRAIGDTLQNVLAMEKARTEYRAALSWMKNVSQQLDPDTTKQVEKFKKVQNQVRRGKTNFDKLAFDCLQKVDLLAAARCNMLNHSLSLYQNKLVGYTTKSARTCSSAAKSLKNKQQDGEVHIKTLVTHKTGNKNNNNEADSSKVSNENLLLSENGGRPLIDNLTSEDLTTSPLEELASNDTSSQADNKDLDDKSNLTLLNISSESPLLKPSNQMNELLMPKSNFNDIPSKENKFIDISKIDWAKEDADSFLPSALLKQSLENITSPLKAEKSDKSNAENKNHSAKSWLNLFEDLDPLANNPTDKSAKNKFC